MLVKCRDFWRIQRFKTQDKILNFAFGICWKYKKVPQLKITHLDIVSIGAGLSEYSWDGWITANFQIIFGALIPLKEISKVASWYSERRCDWQDLYVLITGSWELELHDAYRSPVGEGSSCLWLGE